MTAEQARDRLAALLPGSVVVGYATRVEVSLRRFDPDQAAALADEIEAGRAAVAAVARVEALLKPGDWSGIRQNVPQHLIRRALAPAVAADGGGNEEGGQ